MDIITNLSHEFGTDRYVRGGGGNTSCKDASTLWVKPSGTTLSALSPQRFIALDRVKLARLYTIETPQVPSEREILVKEVMEHATLTGTQGRASVEAPLHDSLSARYVVHTHPYIVNGMTSAKNGKAVCAELFPDALWIDYIDPGYTLSMAVRREIQRYTDQHGVEPALIFLKNHGVFVAADTPDKIRALYAEVMDKLCAKYADAGVEVSLSCGQPSSESALTIDCKLIRKAMGSDDLWIVSSGSFDVALGPISPDHMVYAKAYPYIGEPTVEGITEFKKKNGYSPQVLSFNQSVFGVAENEKGAALALELAKDGALVEQLASAFGGIAYMDDAAREFIENWEAESYRKKQL